MEDGEKGQKIASELQLRKFLETIETDFGEIDPQLLRL